MTEERAIIVFGKPFANVLSQCSTNVLILQRDFVTSVREMQKVKIKMQSDRATVNKRLKCKKQRCKEGV
jgi:hypothetical protein